MVKRVASLSAERKLLGSFNPSYPLLEVKRAEVSLPGTVIAQFSQGPVVPEKRQRGSARSQRIVTDRSYPRSDAGTDPR